MGFRLRSRGCGAFAAFAFSFGVCAELQAAIPASERAALIDFYRSTDGDHWIHNDGWNGPPGTECDWIQVYCDADRNHVTELGFGRFLLFASFNLRGTLPATLRNLTHLEYLDVSYNQLHGPLPDLSGLQELRDIDFSENAFTGPLPTPTDLPALNRFDASQNQLTGDVPSLDGVPGLVYFYAYDNQLDGTLPVLPAGHAIGEFDVHGNQLAGPIPDFAGLPELYYYNVGNNRLTGALPTFTDMPFALGFNAANNRLSGPIPAAWIAPHLVALTVNGNALTGAIPSADQLPAIEVLALGDNHFSGTLDAIAGMTHLVAFKAANNRLSGSIPSLATMPDLDTFDVANNELVGDVPPAPRTDMTGGASSLCPNALTPREDATWDAATGVAPWYTACTHVDLDQFGLTGAWYDPATSGQGILLDAMPDLYGTDAGYLFGGWFTYLPDGASGSPAQHWYSFEGTVDPSAESAVLGLYDTEGGAFLAPPQPATSPVGTLTLAFDDCAAGTMQWHFDDGRVPDGARPLQRLTANTACTILGENGTEAPSAYWSGTWYDPANSGQGLVLHISPSQQILFGAWYTFAPGGTGQRWYTLQRQFFDDITASIDEVSIYTTIDGTFEGTTPPFTPRVGIAHLTFDDCNALTLDYQLIEGDADYTGTAHFVRLGAAPAGCE